MVLLLISVLYCTLLPFARSSEDEVVSSVHLEDTWRTLTEADLRTELHLPRDSKLLISLSRLVIMLQLHLSEVRSFVLYTIDCRHLKVSLPL